MAKKLSLLHGHGGEGFCLRMPLSEISSKREEGRTWLTNHSLWLKG
jgi:hypothetical protein